MALDLPVPESPERRTPAAASPKRTCSANLAPALGVKSREVMLERLVGTMGSFLFSQGAELFLEALALLFDELLFHFCIEVL